MLTCIYSSALKNSLLLHTDLERYNNSSHTPPPSPSYKNIQNWQDPSLFALACADWREGWLEGGTHTLVWWRRTRSPVLQNVEVPRIAVKTVFHRLHYYSAHRWTGKTYIAESVQLLIIRGKYLPTGHERTSLAQLRTHARLGWQYFVITQ